MSRTVLVFLTLTLAMISTTVFGQEPTETGLFYYSPQRFAERSMTYEMVTTGSVVVRSGAVDTHTVTLDLKATFDLEFDAIQPDGAVPFHLHIKEASSVGLSDVARNLTTQRLSGALTADGIVSAVQTPQALGDLGLDMNDLLVGLIVPTPPQSVSQGGQWTATMTRTNLGASRPRSMNLAATYTYQGWMSWASQTLPSVTARLRGSTSFREGSVQTMIEEIGHALFYLRPDSGVTDVSSVSIITTVDTRGGAAPAGQTKITLTTTLELLSIDEPAGGPTAPAPPQAPAASEPPDPVVTPDPSAASKPVETPEAPEPSDPAESVEPPQDDPAQVELPQSEETVGSDHDDEPVAQPPHSVPMKEPPSEAPSSIPVSHYADPAGRFSLALPEPWNAEPHRITLRSTLFGRSDAQGTLYVYAMPLPTPAASALTIANSALATYEETQDGFVVLEAPKGATLDGETAYRSLYQYRDGDGQIVTEWGLFARKNNRAFYVQYAAYGVADAASFEAEFLALVGGFRFGLTPEGRIEASALQKSLIPYNDSHGRFSMTIPSLWPLTDADEDGSSITFAEIGENGYMTIFAQRGASGIEASRIVAAWKEQWSNEPGFELVADVAPSALGDLDGVRLDYRWSAGGGAMWNRRLHAAVVGDSLYAVAIDYVSSGYVERTPIFDQIIQSFKLVAPPSAPPSTQPDAPPSSAPVSQTSTPPATSAVSYPFDEPQGTDTTLLLGRMLTRYTSADGEPLDVWAANVDVYVFAAGREFSGRTDAEGYLYIANLPRLTDGRLYTISRIEGPLFEIERATVNFNNLETGQISPRVAHIRTVVLTLQPNNALNVDVVDDIANLERFVQQFPASGWTPFVQDAIAALRM